MTIHGGHPFADPDPDQVRRLRARVGATVTLWTSGGPLGPRPESSRGAVPTSDAFPRAGLTVSSYLVATGDPGRIAGALDPDADLTETLRVTGRCVVTWLTWPDRALAERFGGTMPAPGGPFAGARFLDTDHGPRPEHATTYALGRLSSEHDLGWSTLVTLVLDEVVVADPDEPWLVHRHGRFARG